MSKPRKYPELDAKFHNALRYYFERHTSTDTENHSGPTILTWIVEPGMAGEFGIAENEAADLKDNWSAYIGRALDARIVHSHGRKKGYSPGDALRPAQEPPTQRDEIQTVPAGAVATGTGFVAISTVLATEPGRAEKRNYQWEGLLHFPASIALALELSGQDLGPKGKSYSLVRSLPKASDKKKWANPDMIAVRRSAWDRASDELHSIEDQSVAELLRKADNSPHWIVSSIELKSYDRPASEVKRDTWYTDLAEAAANSKWANEAIFGFCCRSRDVDDRSSLPPDVLHMAKDMGLSIVEFVLSPGESVKFVRHLWHPPRPTIRLEQICDQDNFLGEVGELLRELDEESSWFESADGEISDAGKFVSLLRLALTNVGRQTGFADMDSDVEDPNAKECFGEQHFGESMPGVGHLAAGLARAIDEFDTLIKPEEMSAPTNGIVSLIEDSNLSGKARRQLDTEG